MENEAVLVKRVNKGNEVNAGNPVMLEIEVNEGVKVTMVQAARQVHKVQQDAGNTENQGHEGFRDFMDATGIKVYVVKKGIKVRDPKEPLGQMEKQVRKDIMDVEVRKGY